MGTFFQRHGGVLVYIPNLIGYARVACTLYSYAVAFTQPWICVTFYFLAFLCDELDGRFARMFNQTSTFGAVLDMVTDRLSTTGLLAILASLYPRLHMLFFLLVWLDIFSHWFQMYSTLAVGAATHKDVHSRAWLVRMYYKHRIFMGFCCVCCEVLYLALYLLNWPATRNAYWLPLALPQGAFLVVPGLTTIAGSDGVSIIAVIAAAALPGFVIKQVCNWVQLQQAVGSLVDMDLAKDKQKTK